MNFYQYPYYFFYFVPETAPLSVQQSEYMPILQSGPSLSVPIDPISQLDKNKKQLQIFLQRLEKQEPQDSSIAYMALNTKVDYEILPNIEEFRLIYSGGLARYKETYKSHEKKVNWGKHDVLVLLWLLDKYCKLEELSPKDLTQTDWNFIAKMIPFRTGNECRFKWQLLSINKLEFYPWSAQEQSCLLRLIQQYEMKDWVKIAKKLFEICGNVFRSPKQCRERWRINLNSKHERCKKAWLKEQDIILLGHFEKKGRRWKQISSSLPGRSENAIKNRFNLLMQKYWRNIKQDSIVPEGEKATFIRNMIQSEIALHKKSNNNPINNQIQLESNQQTNGNKISKLEANSQQ